MAGTSFLVGLQVQGCAYNPSWLHSDLENDELEVRIASRFHRGMAGDQVMSELDELSLEPHAGSVYNRQTLEPEPPGDRGLFITLWPGGFYSTLAYSPHCGITMWFDTNDRLEQIAINRVRRDRESDDPWWTLDRVLLREAPQ